jgi:sulfur carrier protein
MPRQFEVPFVQLDKIRDAADIGLVTVDHHSDSHKLMLRHAWLNVKWRNGRGRMKTLEEIMAAKLVLRDKEYEVRAGMTLLDALKKSNIVPESVIATRDGEMILEDEILREGDSIKLIAVISGGSS